MATFSSASASLFYAHVPLDQPADLPLGVAALDHARDKVVMLLLGLAVLLRAEGNDGQQILDLGEYPLFDHFANLLVAGPRRVLAAVLGARPQRELDDLVAEVLGVGDAGRLFDLGQFLIEQFAIEQLSGVGILEILILDPGIGIVDITIEQVLAVVRIGFEIGLLDLMPDEFGVARRQFGLDELDVAFLDFVGKLLASDRLLQRGRRARRGGQLGALDQLLVDLLLLGDAQAVRHLDDADTVDEGLVVLVGLEALPFGLVGVGENDAGERDRADILGPDIVAFLRCRQQRMQHLDRRLEHFDEFENALVGAVEAARIAVGVGIVLGEGLQLADVDLADQRRDVLVVFIAGFGLGDRDLAQPRRLELGDAEF